MQPDQLPIGGHLFAGNIAGSCLSAQQDPGDRHRVKPIGLRTQPLTLVKLINLPRMQQTQHRAASLQFVIHILGYDKDSYKNGPFDWEKLSPPVCHAPSCASSPSF